MRWLYQPLLLMIARSADSELPKQGEFLNARNRMLRRRVKHVRLDASEERLPVRLARALAWRAVRVLLSVVCPTTYRNRVKALGAGPLPVARRRPPSGKGGRP